MGFGKVTADGFSRHGVCYATDCPDGWTQVQDRCFQLFDSSPATWDDAEVACRALGPHTHLATIMTAAQQAVVAGMATQAVYIGLHILPEALLPTASVSCPAGYYQGATFLMEPKFPGQQNHPSATTLAACAIECSSGNDCTSFLFQDNECDTYTAEPCKESGGGDRCLYGDVKYIPGSDSGLRCVKAKKASDCSDSNFVSQPDITQDTETVGVVGLEWHSKPGRRWV